jgi:predicted metal-dependent HD superfamily phosphohydrolase
MGPDGSFDSTAPDHDSSVGNASAPSGHLVPPLLRAQWYVDTVEHRNADEVLHSIVDHYAQPHRHYHAPAHVFSVLEHVDRFMRAEQIDPASDTARAIRFALWYHDVIYDATSKTNEQDSAVLAEAELAALGIHAHIRSDVHRLIMITKHPAVPNATDENIVHDVDLGILATPDDIYDRYVTQVRAEYAHVSDADWRLGRAGVLRSFLNAERIYYSVTGAEGEATARHNIERELRTLSER